MNVRMFIAAGLVSALALSGCGKKDAAAGNAAMVGTVPVTNKEFFDYLQRKPSFLVSIQGHEGAVSPIVSPGFQALQDLVVNKVVEQIAKDDNVYPTDADVQKELESRQKENPHLVETAIANGYTMDSLKGELRIYLCKFNIVTKGISVTDQEVDAYIKANPNLFLQPAEVQALMILVTTERAKADVDKALLGGAEFQVVASQMSIDKSGQANGYHFPGRTEAQTPKPLWALFQKTPENGKTDWIKANEGYAKFKIEKKTPAKPIEINDMIKGKVKKALMQQRGSQAVDLNARINDKLKQMKDKIQILVKQDEPAWKQFTDQVEKSLTNAKSTSAPGGVTGGAPAPGAVAPGATAPPAGGATK